MKVIEQLIEQLKEENVMYTGVDAGNKSTKVSVLNKAGDIEHFQFSTVIAQTSREYSALAEQQTEVEDPMERLHVRITSSALSKHSQIYYVGEYAQDKENKEEPKVDDTRKANKNLHIVTTLTGLAMAAWTTGREGVVKVPFSSGLPIKEIEDEFAEQYKNKFIGQHEIEALDGPFKGQKITIVIEDKDSIINVEGVTSELAISWMIEKGEISPLPSAKKVANTFAVVDAGAGTLDIGLFDEKGFNATLSKAYDIGTNPHIDRLMDRMVKELFTEQYERTQAKGLNQRPYKTREQFMKKVIFPGVDSIIKNKGKKGFEPEFKANWGSKKADSVKLTEMVLETMTAYAKEVYDKIEDFELETSVESFVFLGGGLLFGYHEFQKLDSQTYIFADDIKTSPSLTSTAYLIRSYGNRVKEAMTQAQTVKA